jgi:multidrug resistance efflux pump
MAQTSIDPEVARAQIELNRVQAMVQTGALPRGQLKKAEAAVEDAEDAATVRKSIYNQDLTGDEADEMVAAAARRFERRKQAFDDAKKLVDAGVMPAQSLTNLRQDMDFARRENDLADTRAALAHEAIEIAQGEEALQAQLAEHPAEVPKIAERFDGDGVFTPQIFQRVETAFTSRFGKALPVSANGETAVHRALGFDHRGRVDVAINPDQPEGVWLREYLTQNRIPFFAFRQAVPGKATGAHIHLGPISTHLAAPPAGGG